MMPMKNSDESRATWRIQLWRVLFAAGVPLALAAGVALAAVRTLLNGEPASAEWLSLSGYLIPCVALAGVGITVLLTAPYKLVIDDEAIHMHRVCGITATLSRDRVVNEHVRSRDADGYVVLQLDGSHKRTVWRISEREWRCQPGRICEAIASWRRAARMA